MRQVEVCRCTMGHLMVTIGHLRVTIGHLRATMGHLRLTIGYLKATVVHIRVLLGHLKVTLGYFFSELHPKVRQTCYFILEATLMKYLFDTHICILSQSHYLGSIIMFKNIFLSGYIDSFIHTYKCLHRNISKSSEVHDNRVAVSIANTEDGEKITN